MLRIKSRPITPRVWRTCPPSLFKTIERLRAEGKIGKSIQLPTQPPDLTTDPPPNRIESMLTRLERIDLWGWCDFEKIWGQQIHLPDFGKLPNAARW
jgi:hypothetical protein